MKWHNTFHTLNGEGSLNCPNCSKEYPQNALYYPEVFNCFSCKLPMTRWELRGFVYTISIDHAPRLVKACADYLSNLQPAEARRELNGLADMLEPSVPDKTASHQQVYLLFENSITFPLFLNTISTFNKLQERIELTLQHEYRSGESLPVHACLLNVQLKGTTTPPEGVAIYFYNSDNGNPESFNIAKGIMHPGSSICLNPELRNFFFAHLKTAFGEGLSIGYQEEIPSENILYRQFKEKDWRRFFFETW